MKNDYTKFLNKNLLFAFVVFFIVQSSFSENTALTEKKNQMQQPKTQALNDSQTKMTTKQDITEMEANTNTKKETAKPTEVSNTNSHTDELTSYSFRPLLIQGKKRMAQKNKDMKVEIGNIVESKLFFIDIDFKNRIFEDEMGPLK